MDNMQVIKRDGNMVSFDETKIYEAILKAMKYGSGIVDEKIARKIAQEIDPNSFIIITNAREVYGKGFK